MSVLSFLRRHRDDDGLRDDSGDWMENTPWPAPEEDTGFGAHVTEALETVQDKPRGVVCSPRQCLNSVACYAPSCYGNADYARAAEMHAGEPRGLNKPEGLNRPEVLAAIRAQAEAETRTARHQPPPPRRPRIYRSVAGDLCDLPLFRATVHAEFIRRHGSNDRWPWPVAYATAYRDRTRNVTIPGYGTEVPAR